MDSMVVQVGVGGMFAIMVLKEVFAFLGTKKDTNDDLTIIMEKQTEILVNISGMVVELHKSHLDAAARTPSGGYKWWTWEAVDRMQLHTDKRFDILERLIEDSNGE